MIIIALCELLLMARFMLQHFSINQHQNMKIITYSTGINKRTHLRLQKNKHKTSDRSHVTTKNKALIYEKSNFYSVSDFRYQGFYSLLSL